MILQEIIDFSDKGTKYLVLTSLICSDICTGIIDLHNCKHSLISAGHDISYFHASEDSQIIRDSVYSIVSNFNHIRIDSVIVEKRKANPVLRDTKRLYPMMINYLLRYPLNQKGIDISKFSKVFIFMDGEYFILRDKEPFIKGVKQYLSKHLKNVPYQICMHPSMSHPYLQVVDYCSWAVYRKWEKTDSRSYTLIDRSNKKRISHFESGKKVW